MRAGDHIGTNGVHFGFNRQDQHIIMAGCGPNANCIVFFDGGATVVASHGCFAQYFGAENLALVHRQIFAGYE